MIEPARIAEIRQENRSGDVSFTDVEWLCRIAEAADEFARAQIQVHRYVGTNLADGDTQQRILRDRGRAQERLFVALAASNPAMRSDS